MAPIIPRMSIIHNQKLGTFNITNGVYSINVPVQKFDTITYRIYAIILHNVMHTKLNHVQYLVWTAISRSAI